MTRLSDCRIDRTVRKVYISFQISRRVFLGPSALTVHAQRKRPFPFNSSNDTLIVFLPCASLSRLQGAISYTDAKGTVG